MTSVPNGACAAAQIQLIAGSLSRTQPCETGYGGTEPDPWIAYPPSKYLGRHNSPSGEMSMPSTDRKILNCPVGVWATAVTPSLVYVYPPPVDVLSTAAIFPPLTIISRSEVRLTSITCPLVDRTRGSAPFFSAAAVFGP